VSEILMDCKYLTGDHWHAMALVRDIGERKCAKEQLLKREREFRTLAENSPDVIVRYDRECRRIYVNPTFERVNRLSSNEVLGKSPVELSTELAPMAVSFTQRLKEVMETGVATQIDLIWTKDGMENCWFVRAIPEFDANGEVVSALTIWCDITERKRAEEALHRLNRELRAISRCNQTLMRAEDEQTLLNDICRIICDEAGYRLAWVGYAEHDDANTVRPVAWAGFDSGYIANANITWADTERGRGPSGTAIRSGESACIHDFTTDPQAAPWRDSALQHGYRSSIALPLKDESANTFGVLNIYSTEPNAITAEEIRLLEGLSGDLAFGIAVLRTRIERKRAEEALKEQYSILRSIIDSANALVFSVDRQYRYTSFNKGHAIAMQAIYGAEIEIGQCLLDYMTVTADREIAKRNLDRALAGEQLMEEAYSGEELRTRKYFHVSHSPINTETGDVIGVAVLAQDMTERKRAEEALRAKQQRLSDMTVELSLAEERERRRIAAELHDNIGQDLVLARIKLGMLAKMPLTDEEAGILGNTREILGGMIQRVRFLTHMISPPILESGGLEAALKWLGRQMETDYGLRVSFVDDTSEKPLTEEMRSVLYHAVRELLINVAKHAESDTARVAVGRECGRIVIRVEDDGIGFNPDAIEESLTRKGGGFGLFNIRRRIIHLGGAFDVESSPGAGTRVTIGMPLTKNNDELWIVNYECMKA